ncbi:MAG: hypothetical protein KDD47_11275, partial [Acidobacteria bacterium]|nr:hypothetical protein [Acidobacteriota bacterium]
MVPTDSALAEDWLIKRNELRTEGSYHMTLDLRWTVKVKPALSPSSLLFLPFQGIRIEQDSWSLQRVDLAPPFLSGEGGTVVCAEVASLLPDLQGAVGALQVPDPGGPDALQRAREIVANSLAGLAVDLISGQGDPGLQVAYNAALSTLLSGCEAEFHENREVSGTAPGTYIAGATGGAVRSEELGFSMASDGGLSLGLLEVGEGLAVNLGAGEAPERTLSSNASVGLRCPPGTSWSLDSFSCQGTTPG